MKNEMKGRTMVGKVVSTKMNKTVTVEVIRTFAHKLYKKTVRKSRRFAAHNEMADINVGDSVKMQETVPMSKRKHFIVIEKL
ncbi:MAG: 30S ribosomal protein S17 [Patescibacteria group bacterium]